MDKSALIKEYFSILENFGSEKSEFERILHEDFRQVEFPNLLNRSGQESNLDETIKRAAMGAKMLSRQTYEIKNMFESAEQMAVEVAWRGKMAIDAGPLKSGSEVKARFCIIVEFKDGKIFRQRNYDCFEPFQ